MLDPPAHALSEFTPPKTVGDFPSYRWVAKKDSGESHLSVHARHLSVDKDFSGYQKRVMVTFSAGTSITFFDIQCTRLCFNGTIGFPVPATQF